MFTQVNDSDSIKIVAQLAKEIWTSHYVPIIGEEQTAYMIEKFQSENAITQQIEQGFQYYLINENDENLGYFAVEPRETELFLSKFYLKSSQRGKGYGRKAMGFIEQIAKEKKLPKITLTANKYNTNSIKIYGKLGFKNAGSIIKDIGNGFVMDDYKFEKIVSK